ncbi:DMT family transporter [Saccharophagus sp. K07]|uniref:DMT family transporter n=1 Tax=Saccharophagus sp. K07 TaxID=2283636 RepID=UPI0016527906|nr:DMT family transporter [Saccharophagus sp. K07]MBC6905796.1 DMT family transporter [Saccharophagus sp. K07]
MSELSPGASRSSANSQLLKGVLFAAIGLLLFAGMDSITKYLTHHYNVPFVVAWRYLVHFGLMVLILAPKGSAPLLHANRRGLVIVRSFALVVSSISVGMALHRMPQADTTAITFLAPMLVALLAFPVLGERIGLLGWAAALMGFCGVLLLARPGSGLDGVGIFFALLAAAANAVYQLLSRLLATTEKAVSMLFYTALVGSLVFGLALPWTWESDVPSMLEYVLFVAMGAAGGLGHYFFTLAYRYAPASVLGPIIYLQLLWAALLGWLVFGTTPDHLSSIGMLIIAASGLMIALKSSAKRKAGTGD